MHHINIPKDKRRSMADLHFDHVQWTNSLRFYKEEIGIFRNRLEEVVSKNTKSEFAARAEHFQNNFILQNEQIDTLAHDIKIHENEMSAFAKEQPIAAEHGTFANHEGLEDRMETFVKLYQELKADFNRFLSEWM